MNTRDPDRCPAATEILRAQNLRQRRVVVQCQESLHHAGRHVFHEDHYTVQWTDPHANQSSELSAREG